MTKAKAPRHILDEVFERVSAKIKEALPGFEVFDEYPKGRRKEIPGSAVYVEIISMDPAERQEAWGSFMLTTEWEMRVVLNTRGGTKRRSMWALASCLVVAIHESTWELEKAQPARVTSCLDEGLDPEAQGYEVWRINWYQDVLLMPSDFETEPTYKLKTLVTRDRSAS